jgi:hypothetical protein
VAREAYVDDVLSRRRSERRLLDEPTTELPVVVPGDPGWMEGPEMPR